MPTMTDFYSFVFPLHSGSCQDHSRSTRGKTPDTRGHESRPWPYAEVDTHFTLTLTLDYIHLRIHIDATLILCVAAVWILNWTKTGLCSATNRNPGFAKLLSNLV